MRLDSGIETAEALKLGKVVEVVAGHGFKLGLEGEVAALGVVGRAIEVGLAERADQLEVPESRGAEQIERGREVVRCVVSGPRILIEGLQERRL